jgi:type I restriction-modification system DNA methylase subunit
MNAETKRHIDAARQVLVGVVPNPTSQIDQITNALIYKFMDDMDQSAIKSGGDASFFTGDLEKYAWTRLMDTRVGNQERMNLYSEALMKFSESKKLPELFRNIFKSAFLPYRAPEVLGLFLKEIDYFSYSHPEELGNAYEYLLSIMSAQGDAGQFRTPRHIIDFIVSVVNPTKEDKVLDPACGTGGFLVSAYNHILEQHDGKNDPKKKEKPLTPDQRRTLMQNFEGYDIDPGMVRIAQVNTYLHQFKNPKINQYDTLSREERWNDKFSVILTNPPFMTPKGGVRPHNKFSVTANRSEILFLDYIIEHLNGPMKAGVIIPEGTLHNNYTSSKTLRGKLIAENLVYAVVELPHGVFKPYASVKTHILFIDRDIAKTKKEVLFINLKNDGYTQTDARKPVEGGQIEDCYKLIESFRTNKKLSDSSLDFNIVKKDTILKDKNISFVGRRYKAITLAEKSNFPVVKLGQEYIEVKKGKSPTENTESGNNIFVVSAKERKTADHYDYDCKAICVPLVSSTGHGHASVRRIHYQEGKFALANIMCAIVVKDEEKINPKYLYYILLSKKDEVLAPLMTGTSNVSLDKDDIYDIEIPLPSIKDQNAFVKAQDTLEKETLNLELRSRKIEEEIIKSSAEIWGK